MMQLISEFQRQGYIITFASAANRSDIAVDLKLLDIEIANIELNNASFDDFITQLQPDIVLFDRFMIEEQYGWRVSEICPQALRILDTEDLHGLRKARELAVKNDKLDFDDCRLNDTMKREIASIYRCDLSLIISEAEMKILTEQFQIPTTLLYYLPFLIDATDVEPNKLPSFEERSHFISIGNFRHPPNYDAVVQLKANIWPLIRAQKPNAELHIYGAYMPPKVEELHSVKEGFIVKGFAKDVDTVMQKYRVLLAPLRFGAGLKGKLFDAMQNGTPCAMSTIAAEGVFGDMQPNGFVSDDYSSYATQAITLYDDETEWNQYQINGFKALKERYHREIFQKDFEKQIIELRNNLTKHRQNNIVGSLLAHHSMQSTKYMSKWIEEKQKR
ncbi:MAG: glycosyltransferase family 4 protein [Winogradskyella sp.]|nr:glycosyltransferase family 4 protein [Winogradskyella sp.]